MARHQVGWFIRRTWKGPPRDGTTHFATSRMIFPTREIAEQVLARHRIADDPLFDYDVQPVWMETEGT